MLTEILNIGDEKGIRIPVDLLRQCNIKDKVLLEVDEGRIIIIPVKKPRENWSESFKKMREDNQDVLLIDDSIDLEQGDWRW